MTPIPRRKSAGRWRKMQAHQAASAARVSAAGEALRTHRRVVALALYGADGFYRCPSTGWIIGALPGDDKVICACRRSNPACPAEGAERTGTHVRRYLEA